MGESVAFGKFENDSLSWEKKSSFSPNKYVEEVGSLSTPGSVAQKKAYFEAHYKKIAAQKDELLELQKPIETDPSILDINQNITDHTESSSSSSSKEVEIEISHNSNNAKISNETGVDELKVDSSAAKYETLIEEADDLLNGKVDSHGIDEKEEICLINDETHQKSQIEEGFKEQNLKLDTRNLSQKVTSKKEENLSETKKKKKLVPIISKLPNTSTKNSSKPEIKSTPISQSHSTAEKSSGSSLSRTKHAKSMETKRVAPKTLHMSLNLDSSNSSVPLPSLSLNRRSSFMETMGDKDIVKRAFKTFQNGFNQSRTSTDECSFRVKETQPIGHVSKEESKQKVSTSKTFRKENERIRNTRENMNTQRSQLGTTWKSVSSGSLKEAGLEGRKLKVSSSSIGSRTDERNEKQKEFFIKVEEKSYAKESGKTRGNSRLTVEKETDINRVKQNLNFKAKPVPDFYRGLKSSTETVGMKTGITRRSQVA